MNKSPTLSISFLFVFLSGIFTACLVLSNIIAGKLILIGPFVVTAGIVIFPVTYILGDVFTEVYGYRKTALVIWTGFAANLLLVLISFVTITLPSPGFFQNAPAYQTVLGLTWRTVIGSLTAYLLGEFTNSAILSLMKKMTKGRFLWMRTIGSTLAGQGIDSIVFLTIVFAGTMPVPVIAGMILTQYGIKVLYEALFTPVTYLAVHLIRKHEHQNVLDEGISYNPFKITGSSTGK
jgi:hypothetical protein